MYSFICLEQSKPILFKNLGRCVVADKGTHGLGQQKEVAHSLMYNWGDLQESKVLQRAGGRMPLPSQKPQARVLERWARGVYPGEAKIYLYTRAYLQTFVAALFIIAKPGKSPNVLQRTNGKGTVVYPYNGAPLGNREKQTLINVTVWVTLGGFMPGGRSQSPKVTYCPVPLP